MEDFGDSSNVALLAEDWRTHHIYAGGIVVISVIILIAGFVIYVENHKQHCPEIREIRISAVIIVSAAIIWIFTGSKSVK
jgi:hypothetical protein